MISFHDVSKLDDDGTVDVFVGPFGCGKTTSMRMIEPTSGTLLPVLIGLAIALPLGVLVQRKAALRRLVAVTANVVFTIPSPALFVILPLVIPTRILDEVNVVVALTLYTAALLVRAVPEALGAGARRGHRGRMGALMVAALALILDAALAFGGWLSAPGTGRLGTAWATLGPRCAAGGAVAYGITGEPNPS